MKNNFQVTTINDEISADLGEVIEFLKIHDLKFVELRTINKKNLVDYSLDEVREIHNLLERNNIQVSAFASPLFKWYPDKAEKRPAEKIDTFSFNPELGLNSKRMYIQKAIAVAKILDTKYVRIFSSLMIPGFKYEFDKDQLLEFALAEAKKENIILLLENEIPCYVNKLEEVRSLAEKFATQGLGIWFDVANFYKLGDQVFFQDLNMLKNHIQYIHLKDFDVNGNYIALGKGVINYKRIVSDLKRIFGNRDVFLSIETHFHADPKGATAESVKYLRSILAEKRKGYGVVGCGQVFSKHGSAISQNEKSELRAVFDINEKRARESAKQFDCEAKKDFQSLLNDDQIDIVNVRTPNDSHVDFVVQTIKKGKSCLCEKPLCLTAKEGKKIVKSKYYKKNVFVNFQNRFNPAVINLFEILKSGKLGKIALCSIDLRCWREDSYFNDWHGDKKRVGGMLFNQGAHGIDLMHQVCGPLKKITKISKSLRNNSKVDDIYLALLEFKNGIIGRIEMTTYTKYRDCEVALFIAGSKGSIKLGGLSFNKIEFLSTTDNVKGELEFKDGPEEKVSSHHKLVQALNEYLLSGKKDGRLAWAEEGLIITQIIEALYK